MGHHVTVATCTLRQWALDFEGNIERILKSIEIAKEKGARYRLGPELEICGYGCNDHFFESDLYLHCWEALAVIMKSPRSQGILCDVGMPVIHRNVKYNCRVYILNGHLLWIRPKIQLANDGNYRELRWFSPWQQKRIEEFSIPRIIRDINGQNDVMIGDGCLRLIDCVLGAETCEELFAPQSPHTYLGLDGVEIFGNGSGSHHELRKLHHRVNLITSATKKIGGLYLYANISGCDGERVYYDGSALIALNGSILAQSPQFSLSEVDVITATIDLEDIRAFRGSNGSYQFQASISEHKLYRIKVDFSLSNHPDQYQSVTPTTPILPFYHTPQQEIWYFYLFIFIYLFLFIYS